MVRDVERVRDLTIRATADQEARHLELARRQVMVAALDRKENEEPALPAPFGGDAAGGRLGRLRARRRDLALLADLAHELIEGLAEALKRRLGGVFGPFSLSRCHGLSS